MPGKPGRSALCILVGCGLAASVGCGGAGSTGNSGTGMGSGGGTVAGPNLYFTSTESYPPFNIIRSIPASANGTVTPTTVFDTQAIHENTSQIAMDRAGNFYSVTIDPPQTATAPVTYKIVEFAASASGSPMPIRTIPGSVTGFNAVTDLTVDSTGNIAAVSGDLYANPRIDTAIRVFSPNKNDGPSQVITGPATGLLVVSAVSCDAAGNFYVIQPMQGTPINSPFFYQLTEFAAGASGNVKPIKTLNLGTNDIVFPPQFDGAGNMYLSSHFTSGEELISVYAPTASGTDAPIRTITLPASADPQGFYSISTPIQVSAAGDIYVVAYDTNPVPGASPLEVILHYAAGVTGVATPVSRIDSTRFNDGSFNEKITLH